MSSDNKLDFEKIAHARHALEEGLIELTRWPKIELVRDLAYAYLGPNPSVTTCNEVNLFRTLDYTLIKKYRTTSINLRTVLNTPEGCRELGVKHVTYYEKRRAVPAITSLGKLAFNPEACLVEDNVSILSLGEDPIEAPDTKFLSIADRHKTASPLLAHIDLDPKPTIDMARYLLLLPAEPQTYQSRVMPPS